MGEGKEERRGGEGEREGRKMRERGRGGEGKGREAEKLDPASIKKTSYATVSNVTQRKNIRPNACFFSACASPC
jgi:hypothetical protein